MREDAYIVYPRLPGNDGAQATLAKSRHVGVMPLSCRRHVGRRLAAA